MLGHNSVSAPFPPLDGVRTVGRSRAILPPASSFVRLDYLGTHQAAGMAGRGLVLIILGCTKHFSWWAGGTEARPPHRGDQASSMVSSCPVGAGAPAPPLSATRQIPRLRVSIKASADCSSPAGGPGHAVRRSTASFGRGGSAAPAGPTPNPSRACFDRDATPSSRRCGHPVGALLRHGAPAGAACVTHGGSGGKREATGGWRPQRGACQGSRVGVLDRRGDGS